ncbi:hypothetical protein Avbf_07299 [Armadillidium vulgare]|nr:hypothetical protein Avbf_07299 [Armadillidium vulgare]
MPDDMNAQLDDPKTPLLEENPPANPPNHHSRLAQSKIQHLRLAQSKIHHSRLAQPKIHHSRPGLHAKMRTKDQRNEKSCKIGEIELLENLDPSIGLVEINDIEKGENQGWTPDRLMKDFKLEEATLSSDQKDELILLLARFPTVLSTGDSDVGCTSVIKHIIETLTDEPVQVPVHPVPVLPLEEAEEVVEEVEDAGAQAGPSESRNQDHVEELERLEEGLDRPERLENMIVVAEEMAMGSGIREITQEEGIIIPNRELQELHLGEDPLRVSRRRNFSPISFDILSEPEMGGGPIRDSRSGWQSSRGNPANRCSRIRTTPKDLEILDRPRGTRLGLEAKEKNIN